MSDNNLKSTDLKVDLDDMRKHVKTIRNLIDVIPFNTLKGKYVVED